MSKAGPVLPAGLAGVFLVWPHLLGQPLLAFTPILQPLDGVDSESRNYKTQAMIQLLQCGLKKQNASSNFNIIFIVKGHRDQ